MSIFTVHEPPLRAADVAADPDRFFFVRDGFSFWAFLAPPLWMLWRQLWLVLVLYTVVWFAIEAGLLVLGAPTTVMVVVALLISLLVGLEAGTLRRFTLSRRGFKTAAIISGADLEDAERRFFGERAEPSRPEVSAAAAPPPPLQPPVPRMPQAPDVIGLFPEPGAHR